MTLEKCVVKYIWYKVDEMILTYRVCAMFQYFAIYFNRIIQDTI